MSPAARSIVMLPPLELLAAFAAVGRSARPFSKVAGGEQTIFACSDYRENGKYSTSTLYLTSISRWLALAERLQGIRHEKGGR